MSDASAASHNDPGDPRARADALADHPVGQSRLGIASIVSCGIMIAGVVVLLILVSRVPIELAGRRGLGDPHITHLMLLMLGAMAVGFLGGVLGLLGLFEPGRKRTTAVAGIISNILVILITIFATLAGGTFG